MQFLLEQVHGHIGLLFGGTGFFFRFGQGALVHLLVLVERDGINLHRHSRNHIRRLLIQDEVVQCLDINGLVTHDVGCNEFAAALLVKCLNRGILDAGELADDTLDLLELDAETAYLDLAVTASHKLDVTRWQVAHDIARAVDAAIFLHVGERVGDIYLGGLLGTVKVAAAHLRSSYPQLACGSDGQPVPLRIYNIQAHVVQRFADGYFF